MSNIDDQPTVTVETPAGRSALAERYDDLHELGRGGMGIVYRARDRHSGGTVALKVLRAEVMADTQAVERFKDELLLARRITHKNVCRVYEINQFGSIAAISMEYVPGHSLRSLLAQVGSLSIRHATKILVQILDGLAEAHAQGVIHRDLKPENILIDTHGVVKVMDFGIARTVNAADTSTSTLTGTPAYMSPEQIAGTRADARSDLYSLGLMMYEMFCGQPPFAADDPMALLAKQATDIPPRPRDVDPDLPPRIERVILECIEKSPERRFQSAAAVKRALTMEQPPTHATPLGVESLPGWLVQWQRSDWALVLGAIVGLIAFVPLFNATNLHHQNQLQFDPAALSQIGREYRQRVGLPLLAPNAITVSTYPSELGFAARTEGHARARAIAGREAQVFGWSLRYPDRSVIEVDPAGALRFFGGGRLDADLQPPVSDEAARRMAEQALREWFAVEASNLDVIGGSSFGPRRAFNWQGRSTVAGLSPRYTISVSGGGTETALRYLALPPGYVWPWRPGMENWYGPVAITLSLILMAWGFAARRRSQAVEPWHLWFAAPIGLAGVLVGWNYLAGRQSASRLAVAAAAGFTLTAAWLFVSALLERLIARVDPRKLTSLRLLCSRAAATSSVGLAVVRGALIGLALLGLDMAALWIATRYFGATLDTDVHVWFVAMALAFGAPAVLVAAVVQMLWIGTFVAVAVALSRSWVSRPSLALIIAAAGLTATGSHFSMASFAEPVFVIALLFVEFLVLVLVFHRYDLLTVFAAVFTLALWSTTAPLLVIFEQVPVRDPQLLLLAWGLVIVAAIIVTAQAAITSIYRRAAATIE
jgi:hypothetical protein